MQYFALTTADGMFLHSIDQNNGLTRVNFVNEAPQGLQMGYIEAMDLMHAMKRAQLNRVYIIEVHGDESSPSFSPVEGFQEPPWFLESWESSSRISTAEEVQQAAERLKRSGRDPQGAGRSH